MNEPTSVWKRLSTIDLRALAAWRIALGLILITDLWWRASSLTAHYTDAGVLPRSDWLALEQEPWHLSLHAMSGAWGFEALLFALAGIAGLAVLFGIRTRTALFISWILLISVQSRNPQILQGGDVLLRCLVFWSLFLPLHARWSIDNLTRSNATTTDHRYSSIAAFAILAQMCMLYAFTAALKSDTIWLGEGSAIWYALHIEQFTTALGRYLANYPELLRYLTYSVITLEISAPLWLLMPYKTELVRGIAATLFIGFHLGLALTMHLGPFPFICMAGWLLYLPPAIWNRAEAMAVRIAARYWDSPPAAPTTLMRIATRFGKNADPTDIHPILSTYLPALYLPLILLWNLRANTFERWESWFPTWINPIVDIVRLDQKWTMFSPYPLTDDGWYVVTGTRIDGRQINLWTPDHAPSDAKPHDIAAMYTTERWRKYLMNLYLVDNMSWRTLYAQYLYREWNAQHYGDDRIRRVDIFFWKKTNRYLQDPILAKDLLWYYEP